MPNRKDAGFAVIRTGRLLYERGFIAGCDGNISVKLDSSRILITPSGLAKGFLTEADLVTIDWNGNRVDGNRERSSEYDMHLAVYRARADINACVHAHPPYATAFAVTDQVMTSAILPEATLFLGEIATTTFAPPGTEQVARSLQSHLSDKDAFILKNHGVLTIGETLDQAHYRMETVEHLAQISYLARRLGAVESLPQEEIARLNELRRALKTEKR